MCRDILFLCSTAYLRNHELDIIHASGMSDSMSFIHSFITQSCGRSSRALWTALCGSIHVAPPTLVLIDQQHANKGSIIRIRYMRCSSIRFLWTWTTHTLSSSLSLSVPSKKDIPKPEETDVTQVCD